MPKCDFNKVALFQVANFIEIQLQHGCSPVHLLHVLRLLFNKNTSRGLLLLLFVQSLMEAQIKKCF